MQELQQSSAYKRRQQHKQTVIRVFVALTWLLVDVQIESITTAKSLWGRYFFYNKQNMFASQIRRTEMQR